MKEKLIGFWRLTRPLNCLMTALAILVGYSLATNYYFSDTVSILLAMVAGFLIAAAGNVINDFFDVEVDKKVHPERPLVKRTFSLKGAREISTFLFYFGVIVTIGINWKCFLIALINSILLVLYSWKGKRKRGFIGNVVISYLTASTFLFGSLAAGSVPLIVIILITMSFSLILGREIVKDIEDIYGDRGEKYTLPMRIGIPNSVMVVTVFVTVALALSVVPIRLAMVEKTYAALIIVADALIACSVIVLWVGLLLNDFVSNLLRISIDLVVLWSPSVKKVMKYGALIAILGFLFGGV